MRMTGVMLFLLISLLPLISARILYNEIIESEERVEEPCTNVWCGEGRECAVRNGSPVCLCSTSCDVTGARRHVICGSDGRTYRSTCEMNRAACFLGEHVEKLHNGPCYVPRAKRYAFLQPMEKPSVCHQSDAEKIKNLLISINRAGTEESRFIACDIDRDLTLSEEEFLTCSLNIVQQRGSYSASLSLEMIRLRTLCIKTLWAIHDADQNGGLGFGEYISLYEAKTNVIPIKKCHHDGREYDEGDEEKSNCNMCVCSIGNWICTAKPCTENYEMPLRFGRNYEEEDSPVTYREALWVPEGGEPPEVPEDHGGDVPLVGPLVGQGDYNVRATSEALEGIDLNEEFSEEKEQLLPRV